MEAKGPSKATLVAKHSAVVAAVHKAIDQLLSPFGPDDYIPGTIEDAVETLREGLRKASEA